MRARLLAELRPRLTDERVLRAVSEVPREHFVPRELRDRAWENAALPIGSGQTISQPEVVARMCELLELSGEEIVLDVGTGSGYHAALLSRLAAHVVSIERLADLSVRAARVLTGLGIGNVTLVVGDGGFGHPQRAPYDAINVAAGTRELPAALADQLGDGGRLVIPLADSQSEHLVRYRRRGGSLIHEAHEQVRFVPLVRDAAPGV